MIFFSIILSWGVGEQDVRIAVDSSKSLANSRKPL
jgi:hypothetical protein